MRFFTCVRHFVTCVLLVKSFSGTNSGFSIEGIGYCSSTGVSDAIGGEGNGAVQGELVAWTWLVGKARKHGQRLAGNW
ncbi:MAG: hypothetical protein ACYDER_09560 [Ktedonobacteraceae bacterium]